MSRLLGSTGEPGETGRAECQRARSSTTNGEKTKQPMCAEAYVAASIADAGLGEEPAMSLLELAISLRRC